MTIKQTFCKDSCTVPSKHFQGTDEFVINKREGNIDLNRNHRFLTSLNCVMIPKRLTFLSQSERNNWLQLPEEDSRGPDISKAEDTNDSVSDDEDRKLTSEETSQLDIMNLPLEISECDSEEENNNGNSVGEWKAVNENPCALDSVSGLSEIKETLYNILIYPSVYPQFFPKKIRWNQILLYGPPGTGKTMLAKALASEINASLYRITSADLLSHWQGQSEKQIKYLFEEIQSNSDLKILFFDEIDGLFRRRTSDENDNTRRLKTEMLIHLDDFTVDFENHRTYLIGATNCPWEIDLSFMRRFHKKIFVPLPDKEARLNIIKKSFEDIKTDLTDSEWNKIGLETEGYSGSDLLNVVMTSCCERFMEVKKTKYWRARGDFWVPVGSESLFSSHLNFEDLDTEKVGVRNIIFSDLMEAIKKTPKTVEAEALLKYLEFSGKK